MEQKVVVATTKKTVSLVQSKKIIRQDSFEIVGSVHTVVRSLLHWLLSESRAYLLTEGYRY